MRIVNPSFGLSATTGEKVALKPVNWKTDAIALVSNSKPNARELLVRRSRQAQRAPPGREHQVPGQEQRQPAGARRTCSRRSPRTTEARC